MYDKDVEVKNRDLSLFSASDGFFTFFSLSLFKFLFRVIFYEHRDIGR